MSSAEGWSGFGQYWPRDAFRKFHVRKQRWAVMVCHRRAGKTVACVADLVGAAKFAKRPDSRFSYIAPLYSQAKDVAWGYVKKLTADIPGVKLFEYELRADFPNGNRVRLYGADNPDRLRGTYNDGCVLDEIDDMKSNVWGEIVRPTLMDRGGWAAFIGTPKGRNQAHKILEQAKTDPENWFHLVLKASESGILPPEEIEAARRDLSPSQFQQELECDFDVAILGAYWGKELSEAQNSGRIAKVDHDPLLPVSVSWDLGVGDSTAIWFFQVCGSEVRVIDYYENHGQGLPHYASILAAKPYRYDVDWVPHDAKVRELGTGRTRVETLIALGRNPQVVPDHKVMDGINAVRQTLPRMWFDQYRCADGLEALKQYQCEYDTSARTFKNTPRHDWCSHACLVAGTMVETARGIIPVESVRSGDEVILASGLSAPVSWSGHVKDSETLRVTFSDGSQLECTPEHKIFSELGVVKADALRYNIAVSTRGKPLWNLHDLALSRDGIRSAVSSNIEASAIGFGSVGRCSAHRETDAKRSFIGSFGKIVSGLFHLRQTCSHWIRTGKTSQPKIGSQFARELVTNCLSASTPFRSSMAANIIGNPVGITSAAGNMVGSTCITTALSPMASIFTIGTVTRQTIALKIWSYCLQAIIHPIMERRILGAAAKRIDCKSWPLENAQRRGMFPRKAGSGIAVMASGVGKIVSLFGLFAKSAGRITKRSGPLEASFAASIVEPVRVVAVERNLHPKPVYDLTVEHHHCYHANGVLVSNSDSMRYLCMAYREIKSESPAKQKPKMLPRRLTMADLDRHVASGDKREYRIGER